MKVSEIMTKDVVSVPLGTSLSRAVRLMKRKHFNEVPITKNGVLKGMAVFTDMLVFGTDRDATVDTVSFTPPVLTPEQEALDALRTIMDTGVQGVPVVRDSKVAGFVSDADVVKAFMSEFRGLRVRDFMSRDVPVLGLDDKMSKAIKLMRFYSKLPVIPVVDEQSRLAGVVDAFETELKLFWPEEKMSGYDAKGESMKHFDFPVRGVRSRARLTAEQSNKIIPVLTKMLESHSNSVIVLDNEERPVGMLVRKNLIFYLAKKLLKSSIMLKFTGFKPDFSTSELLRDCVERHVETLINVLKDLTGIDVHIKGVHASNGMRKFEVNVALRTHGPHFRANRVGYDLLITIDDALGDLEKHIRSKLKKK